MRFTQAYAANPLCSPTRASLLTGLYPARIGITARYNGRRRVTSNPVENFPPEVPAVLREWQGILSSRSLEEILELLNSFDEEARCPRQSSPLCSILSEEERFAIFTKYENELKPQ